MVCEHERDGRAWKAEWILLPETGMAFAACLDAGVRMLGGLCPDPVRMRANIDAHHGYLLSEPVMRALAARVGKHTAHEAVYAAAMYGLDHGQDFRSTLRADPALDSLADEELDGLLEVSAALGSCGAFVDRVQRACAAADRCRGEEDRGAGAGAGADAGEDYV
jgi:adenylosuccinate lyase